MSSIGSKDNSLGKKYDLVIANGTEEVFQQLDKDNKKLNIYNKVIISIPTNSETGEDIVGEASVWMVDSKGQLYQLAKPINKISLVEDKINEIKNNIISDINEYIENLTLENVLENSENLTIEDLKTEFRNILEAEKENIVENISEYIKQTLGIDKNIEQAVSEAYEKINSINKKLKQDINKIIWDNPNIAYLTHIVRTLCGFHNIQYEFDNEYSESEVLHSEHHSLIEKIDELEQRINELQNNGH